MSDNSVGNPPPGTQPYCPEAHAEAASRQHAATGPEPIVAQLGPRAELWGNIPAPLRERPQWCLAGPDKEPLTVTGANASSTDPATWTDFDTACAAASRNGTLPGYVLSADDPFTCIDLDVKDASNEGKPEKWTTPEQFARFESIVRNFASYTERSRSGKGLHIWVEGKIGKGKKRDGVEVYSRARFIVCTGDVYIDEPIHARYGLLDVLYAEMNRGTQLDIELEEVDDPDADDDWYIAKIAQEDTGELGRLFNTGEWQDKYPSASEADLALVKMLGRLTDSNERCWSAFQMSPLGKRLKDGRQKSTRRDYMRRTLTVARTHLANDALQIAHGQHIAEALFWAIRAAAATAVGTLTAKTLRQFLLEFEVIEFLIDDVYRRGWLYTITGKTGSGKTGVAVTISLYIASGMPIGQYGVARGPVLYIAGENPDDVRGRFRAMITGYQWGDEVQDSIHVVDQSFLIEERIGDLEAIIEQLAPVAVIVDTDQAVSLSGDGEENSNNRRMQHAKILRRITRCQSRPTVIDLCHPNASATPDRLVPRGGSSFMNEIDGNTRCWRNESIMTLASDPDKFRGMPFELSFTKEEVELETVKDTKGRNIRMPVFMSATDNQVVLAGFAAYTDRQHLLKAMLAYPHMSQVGWLEQLGWKNGKGEPNKPKVSRMLKALREEDPPLVTQGNHLTPAGKKAAKDVK